MIYGLIIVLILLSALFSGSEISFASASELKLKKAAEELKSLSAKQAKKIKENYDRALISILIGNNLVNIGSSAAATVAAIALMGNAGAGAAAAIMTVLIIIFGEITPKVLASMNPEKFALMVALPIRVFMIITSPLVTVFNGIISSISTLWDENKIDEAVTEDDLETIFETVEDEGVVDEDTADLLQNALDFDNVTAYEIVTPRVDMEAIDSDDNPDDIVRQILNTPYSRLPVYKGTPDHIIGICHVNQSLRSMAQGEEFDLEKMMLPPHFVHKTMPLDDVLETMKKHGCHMIIVTDEYGGTMGLVTMEDVLEQIVGEIWDEKDVIDEEFIELGEDTFEVDGDMRIEDFFDEIDLDEKDFDSDNATMGGWAIEQLGDYPKIGDNFTYKNIKFTVTETDDMRVLSLLAEIQTPEEADAE